MKTELDKLDMNILGVLQANARVPNLEVARRLGVSEGTIRNRLKKMVASGVLSIVALVDQHKLGYGVDTYVGIKCQGGGHVRSVARALAQLDETRFVGITTGRFDIWAYASFRSDHELRDFLLDKLRGVGDVTSETLHVIETTKGLARADRNGHGDLANLARQAPGARTDHDKGTASKKKLEPVERRDELRPATRSSLVGTSTRPSRRTPPPHARIARRGPRAAKI